MFWRSDPPDKGVYKRYEKKLTRKLVFLHEIECIYAVIDREKTTHLNDKWARQLGWNIDKKKRTRTWGMVGKDDHSVKTLREID